MLVNFGTFTSMLFVVWAVGEVLVQALKNKLHIDKMLYSVIVFLVLGVFAIVYNYFVSPVKIEPIYIMNCIVFLVLCVLIPITGYDALVELIKRISK